MRVIVVGAGGISNAWFGALKSEGVEVAALVDVVEERARGQAEKHGLAGAVVGSDLAKVLKDVKADFLLDLTVPEAHCKVVCMALEAGLHVIGEKPMAAHMSEARKMVKTARRTGKLYMVSQSKRWENGPRWLKSAVEQLGDLTGLHCDFFLGGHYGGFRDTMGSPLILDMAIHHFDMARYLCGQNAVSVYAEEMEPKGSWFAGASGAHCLFEMGDGMRFTYRGCWSAEGCHTPWDGEWRVIGTKGTALLRGSGVSMELVTEPAVVEGIFRKKEVVAVPEVKLEKLRMHGALVEFLAFLNGSTRPGTASEDNIESLAMVFGAVESSRRGRRVRVVGVAEEESV